MDLQSRTAIRVDLSSEPPIRIGPVRIVPALRQLGCGSARATLEPRVMQALVVLAQAKGEVVSRDELVLRCWDGVIVGDNAINRVISLLRTAAAETCGGAFRVETIKKVGYRLVEGDGETRDLPAPAAPRTVSRRALIGSALGLAAAGTATVVLLRSRVHAPPPLARELFDRGLLAQKQGLLEQTEQAIAFFTEAVNLDPDYGAAWGALALSYRHKLVDDPGADAGQLGRMIDAAARRALALDPGNADAEVAMLLRQPTYRHWRAREQAFGALLARHPDHWLLRGSLGRLMFDTGRWRAGTALFRANVAHDPFLPISRLSLGQGLWGSGDLQEAEQVFRKALERWPKHPRVWLSSFSFLALSGQPGAAVALASNAAARPPDLPPPVIDRNVRWAQALAGGRAEDLAAACRDIRGLAAEAPGTAPWTAPVLAALGATDDAIFVAQGYFGVRPTIAAWAADRRAAWRETSFLFAPSFARLRADPRFAALTESIGLADYWRQSGTAPDPVAA